MKSMKALLLGVALPALAATSAQAAPTPTYKHVLLISVDGLHAVDLMNWLNRPGPSALKSLSQHGAIFPYAFTTAPSDSFPGMIAQVTGATPKTAGVFYDDSYDRTFFPPSSNCAGGAAAAGAETTYAENIDVNQNLLNAGGTLGQPLTQIDPAKLPQHLVNGACQVVYPHEFIRTNTIFEVIKAAGLRTAWSDKHPAYEILNGPSGTGIDDLYTPEINSLIPGYTTDNTTSFTATRNYDATKVQAVINEINGLDSTGTNQVGVPAIFGLNFQAVSVGQKLATSGPLDPPGLTGGYLDGNATPGNGLTQQLQFVDASIGQMVVALNTAGLASSTLVIVSAKHGQSPIDPTVRVAVTDAPYMLIPGYGFEIADDEALIWLNPHTRTAAQVQEAHHYLSLTAPTLRIQRSGINGPNKLELNYQNPYRDSRTPDFIVEPIHGTIYTTGSKLAEHGGLSNDDRNVALLVSSPLVTPRIDTTPVQTTQIAPTILQALGLNPSLLQGVQNEGTQALPF